MSALFAAMILTGAGGLAGTQGAGKPQSYPVPTPYPVPVPMVAPPAPPVRTAPPPGSLRHAVPPQRARANLNSYFSADDYPASALLARHQGTVGFRLTVGANGRVSDCQLTATSGSQPLDQATCRILRSRARYTPARGSDGGPVVGLDSGRVTWRVPGREDRAGLAQSWSPARLLATDAGRVSAADYPAGAQPPPGPAASSGLRVAVGRGGDVLGCDIEATSGSAALDAAACRLFTARARFAPAHDAGGMVVCDIVWISVDWAPVAVGRPPPPPGTRTPSVRLPRPLPEQLNNRLCPGWVRPPGWAR